MGNNGEEVKGLNVGEGYGIGCGVRCDIEVGMIRGGKGKVVEDGCGRLGMSELYEGE